MAKQTSKPPVAIVGVSALFPGSSDLEGFWRDIVSGTDMIREIPPNYWLIDDYYDPDPTAPDKTYCKRGGFLDKLDFDPVAFGNPPSLLPRPRRPPPRPSTPRPSGCWRRLRHGASHASSVWTSRAYRPRARTAVRPETTCCEWRTAASRPTSRQRRGSPCLPVP